MVPKAMKDPITVYPLKGRIPTKDGTGEPNGWLQAVWSAADPLPDGYRPDQVYVTAIAPGATKGPHLHKCRTGLFTCIAGSAFLRARLSDGVYTSVSLDGQLVRVEPGIAAQLVNDTDSEAIIINMPSPSWQEHAPDEWPVEGWKP
jgi:dTDP-4-dehydrorhamnose 3,5-epimerase-like enzyme